MLGEGVKFEAPGFEFDFSHDGKDDVIELKPGLKKSEAFGNTYFFQYEFGESVLPDVRSKFIHALKFDQSQLGERNVELFTSRALGNLNRAVNLATVDIVIYPTSSSRLVSDMLLMMDRLTDANRYIKLEAVKKATSEIGFNWGKFIEYCENKGIPADVRKIMRGKMEKMLADIRKLDYFSIAQNIRGQKYKSFLKAIYKFYDANTLEILKTAKGKKILIIDDVYTSGVTVDQILKAYHAIGPDDSNSITVFTLIGKRGRK